jgi:hypothetical protein
MGWVKIIFYENFTKNIQFYGYLGRGMGIDSQFLGYWVLSMGWVKIIFNENISKNTQFYEYLGMGLGTGMGWVDIPKPIPIPKYLTIIEDNRV